MTLWIHLVVHLLLKLILEPANPPLQALNMFGEEGDGGGALLLSFSPVRSTPTPEGNAAVSTDLLPNPDRC